jgi:hypothetical protein
MLEAGKRIQKASNSGQTRSFFPLDFICQFRFVYDHKNLLFKTSLAKPINGIMIRKGEITDQAVAGRPSSGMSNKSPGSLIRG